MDVFTVALRRIVSQTALISGTQTLQWNLKDQIGDWAANGIYYVRLRIEGSQSMTQIEKVLILR